VVSSGLSDIGYASPGWCWPADGARWFPEAHRSGHTVLVTDKTEQQGNAWRPWTIGVSGSLALVASILLLVADGLVGILASWGGPASAGAWITAAAIGHGVLAVATVVLLAVGLARPPRRRAAVLAAWAIIPVGAGWFLLCGRLAGG
jgi:hypothetical protein